MKKLKVYKLKKAEQHINGLNLVKTEIKKDMKPFITLWNENTP